MSNNIQDIHSAGAELVDVQTEMVDVLTEMVDVLTEMVDVEMVDERTEITQITKN